MVEDVKNSPLKYKDVESLAIEVRMRLQREGVPLGNVAKVLQGGKVSLRDLKLYFQNKLKFDPDES